MEVVYLLVPVSVVLVFGIAVAFWWSVKSGQFDDLEGPAYRILMDDDLPKPRAGQTGKPAAGSRSDADQTEPAGKVR